MIDTTRRWQCTACDLQHVTHEPRAHVPMHPCRKLAGILAPFTEVTGIELDRTAQRLVVVERDDYERNEILRRDANGRPVMAVRTERADGSNDTHVFAPTATNRKD